jgi:vacuolar-type H+-ATPase subunit H
VIENADLQSKLEELRAMNRNRFDYVLVRARSRSISAALEEIGLTSKWYYAFSEGERKHLEELADDLHKEKRMQAEMILAQAMPEAATVKVEGLKSKDRRIQQDSASEILDRGLGKPIQKNELTGKDGKDLPAAIINVYLPDNDRH